MSARLPYYKAGLRDGLPIGLGYIAVSFTFGIMARKTGLTIFQAVLISLTNLTSAGQFAALDLIAAGAPYLELAAAQLIINLRYSLMSFAIAQKFDRRFPFFHRFFVAFGITDEIFAVSVYRPEKLNPFYSYGLMTMAIPGWTLGTLIGAISGGLLPPRLLSALSVALYGMFLAIIIPPAKQSRILLTVVISSMLLSFLFSVLPVLKLISSGFRIIILTLLIAGLAAFFCPVREEPQIKEGQAGEH